METGLVFWPEAILNLVVGLWGESGHRVVYPREAVTGPMEQMVGGAQEQVGVVGTGRAGEPVPDSVCEVAPQQIGLEVAPDKNASSDVSRGVRTGCL